MRGITAYGAYVPYNRLQRSAIGDVLGSGGGRGTRAVASYDEDTTTMGAEAGRIALRGSVTQPQRIYFATAAPAYLDKTNAGAIHAALDLDDDVLAVDMLGSVRSGVGALLAAQDASVPTLAILSDIRTGLPGGADESAGGDGAAAFVFGDGDVVAEFVGHASVTDEFLDRWRLPGDRASRQWEERFGEFAYGPASEAAFADACKQAGMVADQIDHLVVAGSHARAARAFTVSSAVAKEKVADDFASTLGNTGTAQAGIVLADVLDRAGADELIAVVVLSDGASVILLRTTDALLSRRSASSVASQAASGNDGLRYAAFLSWRGMLDKEGPRRPDPEPAYAPPSHRREDWKFAFVGSRCEDCGMRHLPPSRVCVSCRSVDRMSRDRLADTPATVATYTIDKLAYSPSPPLVFAVIDFDGGGRFRSQMTDVDPAEVAIGTPVEMTFRRFVTARGIHNYFWKAKPRRQP